MEPSDKRRRDASRSGVAVRRVESRSMVEADIFSDARLERSANKQHEESARVNLLFVRDDGSWVQRVGCEGKDLLNLANIN